MNDQVVTALIIAAAVVAGVDEFQAGGKSLTDWAVLLLCVALLLWRLG